MGNPRLNAAIGMEEEFPGSDIIRFNFTSALGNDFKIYQSLDETVEQAVRLATTITLPIA